MFTRSLFFTLAAFFFLVGGSQAFAATETVRIYASSGDGQAGVGTLEALSDWSTARLYEGAVTYTTQDTEINNTARSDKVAGAYRIYRGSIPFDTSVIPTDSEIQSVVFALHGYNDRGSVGGAKACVGVHDRVNPVDILGEDYHVSRHKHSPISPIVPLADYQYTEFTLNQLGIEHVNVEGYTSYSVRTHFDCEDIDPGGTGSRNVIWFSSESPGTSTDPYLEITYTIPDEENEFPLITQIASPYPPESSSWANLPYADGRADYEKSCGSTIRQCGCALVSFAMLGQSYGLETGADGSEAIPPNIDAWLLANDGYDAKGNIKWHEAIKYFGEERDDGVYSYFTIDAENETSRTIIDDYLANEKPVITKTKATNRDGTQYTHFVLSTELDGTTHAVNDPLWYNTENLDDVRDRDVWVQDYNDVVNGGRLFSFNTDMTAVAQSISIHLASPAELLMTDSNGNKLGVDPRSDETYEETGSGEYYYQEAFYSEELAESGEDPHVTKIMSIPEVADGVYMLDVIGTGDGEYSLSIHTNDKNGYGNLVNIEEEIEEGAVDTYVLFMGDVQEDVLDRIDEFDTYVERLPRKLRQGLTNQLSEIREEIEENGVVQLRPLVRLLMLEEVTLHDLKKLLLKKKWWGGFDHDHGHGNEQDGCDEDNRGKSKRCDGHAPVQYGYGWKKHW